MDGTIRQRVPGLTGRNLYGSKEALTGASICPWCRFSIGLYSTRDYLVLSVFPILYSGAQHGLGKRHP